MTQNLGIHDQRLALQWIQENIRQFGGDPSRITITGQSVGGLSVDYHTYAWPENPIAHAAMSISGTAASVEPNTAAFSQSAWFQLAGVLGCPTSGNAVPCMQQQTTQQILAGIAKLQFAPTKALFQPLFQETVDEVVVFSDYAARGAAGDFAKIVSSLSLYFVDIGWLTNNSRTLLGT
jgi:carboxylesterase type B